MTVLVEFLLLLNAVHHIPWGENLERRPRAGRVFRAIVVVNVASYILLSVAPVVFPEERGLFFEARDALADAETAVYHDP